MGRLVNITYVREPVYGRSGNSVRRACGWADRSAGVQTNVRACEQEFGRVICSIKYLIKCVVKILFKHSCVTLNINAEGEEGREWGRDGWVGEKGGAKDEVGADGRFGKC